MSHLEIKFLPGIRWSLLRTIHVGGHLGATETMCKQVIDAEYVGVLSPSAMRDQFHYLEQRKLISVTKPELEPWYAVLTRHGYDVVEYRVDCEPGIARPPSLAG